MPNQKYHTEWQRRYREKKKLKGECYDCKNSAVPNRTRCAEHLRVMRLNAELFRERYKERRKKLNEYKYDRLKPVCKCASNKSAVRGNSNSKFWFCPDCKLLRKGKHATTNDT